MKNLLLVFTFIFTLFLTSCATRVVSSPANTVTIVKRPPQYKTVRVNGNRYYVWNGRYHKKTRKGYVVVRI